MSEHAGFLPIEDLREIFSYTPGNTDEHIDHYMAGYHIALNAAREHLSHILARRARRNPQVFKPERINWEVFHNRLKHPLFSWEFTEENRERAENIGIHYLQRVIDIYPQSRLEPEIEAIRADIETEMRLGAKNLKEFRPENHYTAELRPITPEERFLNHDRSLYSEMAGGITSAATVLYLDLLGEEAIFLQPPWRLTQKDFKLDFLQSLQKHGIDPSGEMDLDILRSNFRLGFYMALVNQIPDTAYYYRRHLKRIAKTGSLIIPDQDKKGPTYIKKYDPEIDTNGTVTGTGLMTVRFQIDVQKLLESRNIFADPEQIYMGEEYGKTFLVPGGIPLNAIHRWDFWVDSNQGAPQMNEARM